MKPTTVKRIRVTIGAMIIVAGVSTTSLAQLDVAPNIPMVKQGPSYYPTFQPFRFTNDSLPSSEYIKSTQQKTLRGAFGEKLADWNVITPKNQMVLSVSCDKKDTDVERDVETDVETKVGTKVEKKVGTKVEKKAESVLWKFNKDDYFSKTDIESDEVHVIAWRPFIATAEVTCEGDSKSRIYESWIEVD